MSTERNEPSTPDTPGSGASPPEPLRPPEAPDELWGVWRPGVEVWLPQDPSRNYRDNPLSYTKREAAQGRADDWNRRMKHDIRAPAFPALLGVSPVVVVQRDKLGKVLETALRYIEDSDLYGSEVAYGVARAALAEWRAAQEREGKGSTTDG
jgi:hypothetical protein